MTKRLIRHDPVRRLSIFLEIDSDGNFVFTEQQTGTRRLQSRITEAANEWRYGDLIGHTQRHEQRVAEIPLVVVHDLMRRGIWRDEKKMRQWLNDRDNRAFRTSGGRV